MTPRSGGSQAATRPVVEVSSAVRDRASAICSRRRRIVGDDRMHKRQRAYHLGDAAAAADRMVFSYRAVADGYCATVGRQRDEHAAAVAPSAAVSGGVIADSAIDDAHDTRI